MFIKEIKKRNSSFGREFICHRLMESYRTERGPRQRTILNLGTLNLAKERWKELADCIEAKVTGQQSLFEVDHYIEQLATHYSSILIHRRLTVMPGERKEKEEPEYETVDIKSFSHSQTRTIGAEYVGLSMFKKLGLGQLFERLGFSKRENDLVALSIVGRLVHPGSERRTRKWAQHLSGLDELLGTDFSQLSNNALYRILDMQLSHKEEIEQHLKIRERHLFSLKENIILYDLTNTYFEGEAKNNTKAKQGRSKEKRKDAPLLTLGMVIDEMGFPKTSKIFEGNVSEPGTLIEMIEALQGSTIERKSNSEKKEFSKKNNKGITVIIDAGISKEENLTFLKGEGYDYICVARNKPIDFSEIDKTALLTIKKDKDNKVEVEMIKKEDETILYCKSSLKAKKEEAMRSLFQERFEKELKKIAASLSKKGGTKKYDKVLERIGRQKERYSPIAHYYKIEVENKNGIATSIDWKFYNEQKAQERFSGSYFLRTSRMDLTEEEIWSLYVMLTNVEDAFRYLKSELNLRPIWHQKEARSDAHLFNAVLAYHLLVSIQTELRRDEINMRWWYIRELLSSHVRITTAMTNKKGERIYIRDCTDPEPFHKRIYNALKLNYYPIKAKRIKI
jgi:hypothetical protein